MNYQAWQQFLDRHGDDVLIDEKTLTRDWPDCPTPDCGNKVCMWAGEGLCHPCTQMKIGKDEIKRRFMETHLGKEERDD